MAADTLNEPWPEHGGALDRAAVRHGIPAGRWLDLSTGINPLPYPLPALALERWTRLPDAALAAALQAAAARRYGVDDPACIVAGPGTQALIQWLPRLAAPCRVAVLAPTYAEHVHAWSAAGHAVAEVADLAGATDADVVVVVNPNNPDGRVIEPPRLLETADRVAGRGGLVVVDEAFADVVPAASLAHHAGRPGLAVLRSFGKIYGLAGVRLGFALMAPAAAARLRRALGPWAVAGPAAEVGIHALGDDAWLEAARERLTRDAARLDRLLAESGLGVIGGTPLFRLTDSDDAGALHQHLARAAILTRRFSGQPRWLRFGIPADDAAFARLGAALDAWRALARDPCA